MSGAPAMTSAAGDHWPDGDEPLVLVDAADRALGTATKREAHVAGLLHRAFSVFLVDDRGQVLLQRRAPTKYHSGGLWTNTACGHPRPGEPTSIAAERRLAEEMGVRCSLKPAGLLHYRAAVGNGLVEHEVDHVFVGRWQGAPHPDPAEVCDWRWMAADELALALRTQPDRFTAWIAGALECAGRHPFLRQSAAA